MADTQNETPKRKRPTRAQLSERLSIPLGATEAEDPDAFAARRQRIRDRAGDEALPRGTGRARK